MVDRYHWKISLLLQRINDLVIDSIKKYSNWWFGCEDIQETTGKHFFVVVSNMDQTILESRIITQEFDFPGFPSLTRCAERLQSLQHAISTTSTTTTTTNTEEPPSSSTTITTKPDVTPYEAYVRELLSYKLEMTKTCRSFRTSDIEASNYQRAAMAMTEEIVRVREEVLSLEITLKQQEEIRKHRERMETLAKEVNQRPARSVLKRKIAAIEDELGLVNASITAADAHVQLRMEQFAEVQRAVTCMQEHLEKDNVPLVEQDGGV